MFGHNGARGHLCSLHGDIAHSDSQTAWTPYGEVNGGKDLENV